MRVWYKIIKRVFGEGFLSLIPLPYVVKRQKVRGRSFKIVHASAFSYGNAGDTLLPIVLRDLIEKKTCVKKWYSLHVHRIVNGGILRLLNSKDALIIGGGGLFLKDTNPNELSGWQWSCSIENLRKIKIPIIMFAVGYNRFRGQDEFEPIFIKHLNEFVSKASFVGIRNTGSIEKLKGYLYADELKEKLVYQPCMTTLISKIYPEFCEYDNKEDYIAINCAFDREHLRIKSDETLRSIAYVVSKLSKKTKIRYFSHMKSDLKILPYFDELKVQYKLVEFKHPQQIILEYSKPRLVIGMRGHAQMIPFGCKTPILSIVSHDKMQWFLNDICNPTWGVDVNESEFELVLFDKAMELYSNYRKSVSEIAQQQERLWKITKDNLEVINNTIII